MYFPVGKSHFDPAFQGNGAAIDAFLRVASTLQHAEDETVKVEGIYIYSGSSPDGSEALNSRLSLARQQSIEDYLRQRMAIGTEVERSTEIYDWSALKELVQNDFDMPAASRREVLAALETAPQNAMSFRKAISASAWAYLRKTHYPAMRKTTVVFNWSRTKIKSLEVPHKAAMAQVSVPPVEFRVNPLPAKAVQPFVPTSNRDIILKVNALVLPLLVGNIGIEYQPLKHFSISMNAYYTSLDWLTSTIKFRVLGIQPEVRWWLSKDMVGFFAGAHFTFSWYNIALGGDWRYQDHGTHMPVLGGGVNAGYKIPLGNDSDSRWGLEFSIGAGVLPLYYDIYYNVPNGRKAGENRVTYWGIDHAAVTITYRVGRYKVREK